MASVYRYAYITIAATASQNSREGCFWRAEDDIIPRPLRHTPGLMVQAAKLSENPFGFNPKSTQHPLLRRAWVHQERRLSARMVHFTSKQLVWVCQALIQGENGTVYQDPSYDNVSSWHSNVEEYSGLNLTFEDDRLPAIGAIAEDEMKVRQDDVYIAGMWKNTILLDLLWQRYAGFSYPRPLREVPSWSWASVKGGVHFKQFERLFDGVKVSNVSFTPSEPAHMGGQTHASLSLRGPMTEATLEEFSLGITQMRPGRSDGSACSLPPNIDAAGLIADYTWQDESCSKTFGRLFFVFFGLLEYSVPIAIGLVLRQRPDHNFERIGTCQCFSIDPHRTEDVETKLTNVLSYISRLPVKEVKMV